MIKHEVLRQLAIEVLRHDRAGDYGALEAKVQDLAAVHGLFPSPEESRAAGLDPSYYGNGRLNPIDCEHLKDVMWDLISERVISPVGTGYSATGWPQFKITAFGELVIQKGVPAYYDPDGYIASMEALAPGLDDVIKQYVREALDCYARSLHFACAVMLGAAAEKAVLSLLQAMATWETDPARRRVMLASLQQPSLPTIFKLVQETIERASKQIPYSVHEGSVPHLLSLFEMIRTHRNDSVHPRVGEVTPVKLHLTIQTLPAAMEIVYRLVRWFDNQTQTP